jgi:ubiquinone/menaquinone biosynthesis C-methylase UbiE
MYIKRQVTTYQGLTSWYDDHYSANGTWSTSPPYAQTLLQMLLQSGLGEIERPKLLDIACGGGFFLEYNGHAFMYSCGCDISHVALTEARRRCPRLNLCQANSEFLPYADQRFEVVTCLGSLEHFLSPKRALTEIRRVVVPHGLVLILVPTNPAWALYDIQPTEIVMDAQEWESMFQQCMFQTIFSMATDQDQALKSSSDGCYVYCLRPALSNV